MVSEKRHGVEVRFPGMHCGQLRGSPNHTHSRSPFYLCALSFGKKILIHFSCCCCCVYICFISTQTLKFLTISISPPLFLLNYELLSTDYNSFLFVGKYFHRPKWAYKGWKANHQIFHSQLIGAQIENYTVQNNKNPNKTFEFQSVYQIGKIHFTKSGMILFFFFNKKVA